MPVNLVATPASDLYPVPGVRWGITEAGIRKANRKDLAVLLLDEGASVGAVFTQNRFCAAPVQLCREHIAQNFGIRAMVINTGNANAGTGEDGLMRAKASCIALAKDLDLAPEQILPFSTGVIMEPLPHERIEAGLPAAIADAKENAKRNNITNCEFFVGDMKNVFNDDFIKTHGHPDVIITDPPRAGMHDDVIKTILFASPERIVYVS